MKIIPFLSVLIITSTITLSGLAAESAPKPEARDPGAKAEDRMRDEKRRDEQAARSHASNVKVARFDSVWRPPRTEDIDVFQIGDAVPNRARKTIALLTFDCQLLEETRAVAGFIAKAKDLGADGVIFLSSDVPGSTQCVTSLRAPSDWHLFRAAAIVYK